MMQLITATTTTTTTTDMLLLSAVLAASVYFTSTVMKEEEESEEELEEAPVLEASPIGPCPNAPSKSSSSFRFEDPALKVFPHPSSYAPTADPTLLYRNGNVVGVDDRTSVRRQLFDDEEDNRLSPVVAAALDAYKSSGSVSKIGRKAFFFAPNCNPLKGTIHWFGHQGTLHTNSVVELKQQFAVGNNLSYNVLTRGAFVPLATLEEVPSSVLVETVVEFDEAFRHTSLHPEDSSVLMEPVVFAQSTGTSKYAFDWDDDDDDDDDEVNFPMADDELDAEGEAAEEPVVEEPVVEEPVVEEPVVEEPVRPVAAAPKAVVLRRSPRLAAKAKAKASAKEKAVKKPTRFSRRIRGMKPV